MYNIEPQQTCSYYSWMPSPFNLKRNNISSKILHINMFKECQTKDDKFRLHCLGFWYFRYIIHGVRISFTLIIKTLSKQIPIIM